MCVRRLLLAACLALGLGQILGFSEAARAAPVIPAAAAIGQQVASGAEFVRWRRHWHRRHWHHRRWHHRRWHHRRHWRHYGWYRRHHHHRHHYRAHHARRGGWVDPRGY
jgi:hypothetical protein